jgi:cell division protein FtsN
MGSDLPETDIHADQIHKKHVKPFAVVLLTAAAVVAFLLGCYVVGPWATRSHTTQVLDAPPVSTPSPVALTPVPETEEARPSVAPKQSSTATVRVTLADDPRERTVPSPKTHNFRNPFERPATSPNVQARPKSASVTPTVSNDAPTVKDQHSSKLYRVRAGIFADRTNADALATKLSASGFTPSIHQESGSSGTLYAVQVGAYRNKESADTLGNSLKSSGFESYIIVSDQ